MKATCIALALLTAGALIPLGLSGTVEAGDIHTGKGTVLSVNIREGRILMTEGLRGTHVLVLNPQTKVVDETGAEILVTTLRPGDLVREECRLVQNGNGVARQIRLLRPAWMETASPEL